MASTGDDYITVGIFTTGTAFYSAATGEYFDWRKKMYVVGDVDDKRAKPRKRRRDAGEKPRRAIRFEDV